MKRSMLRMVGWCALVAGIAGILGTTQAQQSPYRPATPSTSPGAPTAPVTYSGTYAVRLPVQLDDRARATFKELKLFVRSGTGDWICAQTAPPTQNIFDFRADKDGEFAFFFVTVDRVGRMNPPSMEGRSPHQIIVFDTQKPQLGVQLYPHAKSEIFLQAQVRDVNPDWSTVKLEHLDGNQWKPLAAVSAEMPTVFRVPHAGVLDGKVRVSASDKAGNAAERVIDLGDPVDTARTPNPLKNEPSVLPSDLQKTPGTVGEKTTQVGFTPDVKNPGDGKSIPEVKIPMLDPSEMKIPLLDGPMFPDPSAVRRDPPMGNPKSPEQPTKTDKPMKRDPFLPDSISTLPNLDPVERLEPMKATTPADLEPIKVPSVVDKAAPAVEKEKPAPAVEKESASSNYIVINTARCSLEYTVETTPFSGPAKVEFWATRDNGRSWQMLADESGGKSPAKLMLPGEGAFGIKARTNGNGQAPAPSDSPDCWIELDVTKPVVNLLPATLGTGAEAGTLTVQWTAQDKNLVRDSINIYYATRPAGPWLPIVIGTKNNGSYRWTVPQGLGSELYIRLDAIDRAGNMGRCELREPVVLPQPRVRVLNITPTK